METIPTIDLEAQIADCREEIDAAISETLDRRSFCLGPDVEAFEREFADYLGVEDVIGCNSGTSALHLALKVLDIGPGDEVIIPPMTFVATAWAVSYVGATPVFADIDPATWCLDPEKVEAAITSKTKAVVPVHLYGHPADMDAIRAVCESRGIAVVEDAAQAHGALYKGRKAGSIADLACFSFYPGKNLGACGEGGALIARNPEHAARARSLRNHGSTERYYHDEVGFNYRMEGVQAAVLRVKLKRLENWIEKRNAAAQRYLEAWKTLDIGLPVSADDVRHAWHLFVLRAANRDEFVKRLAARGVGTALHYPVPLHLQKCYESLGGREGDLPVAEALARECVSVPMFAELSEDAIQRVISAVGTSV